MNENEEERAIRLEMEALAASEKARREQVGHTHGVEERDRVSTPEST